MLAPRIPVACEGYPFIGFAAFSTLVFASLEMTSAALACLGLTSFALYFFRDPERVQPTEKNSITSPADGRILLVEPSENYDFTETPSIKVSIFMNIFNVHVNRAPLAGTIEKIVYRPGQFHSADSVKGGLQNEYCATFLKTPTGKKITFVQIAGLIARRIVCWLEPGDEVATGERFGLIRFGSRVDLYLPADSAITVKVGDKVRAGESVLGYLD